MRRQLRRTVLAALVIVATAGTTSGCGSSDANGPPLSIIAYQGADWVTNGTVKPPATPGQEDRVRYPHTMDGAVMAAVNSQTMLDLATDGQFGAIAADYFTVGEGYRAYLDARRKITVTGIDAAKLPRVKGFRFFEFTDQAATVEIFLAQPDHSITGLTRRVVWLGESWLIELPAPTEKTVKAYDALPSDMNPLPQT
ncbi:hypothetical protein OG225_42835 (plasmid) [Nocardia sp. NBC_01377]|uniref:hypothetical protein n=1 Tax=Nocardia sp. NBC_01377 TaxID=2903595 RepID=UPI00324B2007